MKKNNYKYLLACASGIALLIAQGHTAIAAGPNSDTEDMVVNVTPMTVCDMNVPASIAFGEVSIWDSLPIIVEYNIEVSCTNSTTYNIRHDGGLDGVDILGRMVNGASELLYAFYRGSVSSYETWTLNTEDYPGTGNGAVQQLPASMQIYNIANFNNVTLPGTVHTDTVTFTLTF